jgi:hypothetical protein
MRDKILCAALVLSCLAVAVRAQVTVINMVPNAKSSETGQDSEPNLTVNPANPQQMVGSAFTFATGINPPNAPVYVSTDGGTTWTLNNIVPSPGGITGDITVRFGGTSNMLYAGILRGGQPTLTMDILRTPTFSGATPMSVLVTRTDPNGIGVDQPWIQATTALGGTGTGLDRVFVGDNDLDDLNGQTATVDSSQNATSGTAPYGFGFSRVEKRTTIFQDGPPVRPIYHWDGTVYTAFFRWTNFVQDAVDPQNKGVATSDVVVVRDDAWGAGANPFQALKDTDNLAGKKVVVGTTIQIDNTNNVNFGRERRGGSLSIAVDPRSSSRVYLAWGDDTSGTTTLHVRRSDNRGVTWSSADLITITKATNPALAVNTHGKVGFLYQQITGTGATEKWETHFRRSADLGVTWNDLTLAQPLTSTPTPKGKPYIGDYLHLLAQGKDFYGVFSASNKPDPANFPAVLPTYQRNADWTNKVLRNVANTANVSVSIDPFFFKSQELATGLDFYVRDWTDSPTSGDTGLEPSTHPLFYITSDVWNRRGTLTGAPFPNDQPVNEPAGNGPGNIGDNWAFARIRRNATSAAAQTVTAHFLVSKFGTGSNYVDASSADPDVTFFGPDPTVTFAANNLGPIITPAYKWHLNAVTGDHLCLAVEISTPSDPFVAPSLRGFAPGWPTTDLKVLLDNNKAQRNLGLSKTPARGIGLYADYYGVAHNAGLMPRDMELRYSIDPEVYSRIHDGMIEVVGQGVLPLSTEGTIVLPNVQPGENRWIRVSLPPVFGSPSEILPVNFEEMVQDQPVDGFAIGIEPASTTDVATATLESHRSIYTRLAAGFGVADAQAEADAAQSLLSSTAVTGEQYAAFLDQHLPAMNNLMSQLGGVLAGDPFGSQAALDNVNQLKAAGSDADTLAVAHTSFLNRLDTLLTQRQLAQGDRADILQMVRWMQDLYLRVPVLAEREEAASIVDASRAWVDQWNDRLVDYADYPGLLQGVDTALQQTAQGLGSALPGLSAALSNLEGAVASGDLTATEKAHRDVLLQLQTLETGGTAP